MSRTERTELLLGHEAVQGLGGAFVAVFGLGGVGSFAAEALARAGVGKLLLVDSDVVSESNINRQLIALTSTVGQPKTRVMAQRIREINPDAQVLEAQTFFTPENAGEFPFDQLDYIVDAIDTVSSKVELICRAKAAGTPIISCMGAGNKLDPTRFVVTDLYATSTCPLARVLRQQLRKRGVDALQVVYSTEPARTPLETVSEGGRRQLPGSVPFVPPVAGFVAAGAVIRALCGVEDGTSEKQG